MEEMKDRVVLEMYTGGYLKAEVSATWLDTSVADSLANRLHQLLL